VFPEGFNRRSKTVAPSRPDEILFRRRNAPPRYAESDYYFAHAQLERTGKRLPSSDLVKALHGYIAGFFKDDRVMEKSMDETALLALAILMEETAAQVLGDTGDLAFTEPEGADGAS
jgi:hypothetical protein